MFPKVFIKNREEETKRKEGEWVLSSRVELICTIREAREGGLVFWIHKDWLDSLVETNRESDRIITATFEFPRFHLHVINVYAPTSAASETQSVKFYKDLKSIHTTSEVGFVDHCLRRLQRRRGMLFGPSSIRGRTRNWSKKRKRRSAGELCVLQQSDKTQYDLTQTAQPKVDMDQPGRKGEKLNRLHPDEQARNCSRLRSIIFRSTAKKEKSRKFAKTKRAGGERSLDPVRFKNTISEMLAENPPIRYEDLTETIRKAASSATLASHQLSRISEATKNPMLSRFQAIHTGQTKDADLAEINKEVRRSLENDLDKWREFQSLEAAMKGRSLKKMKRALTLKATSFTNLERPDRSTTFPIS
uniref:Uncharacterized protein n=1 Tax=Caenorhabditis japonica TaxID=281687 RepID=A0A8R1E6I7_CAEJA